MRAAIVALLLLGTASAEPVNPPDMIPAEVVNAAILELKAQGQELLDERNAALDELDKLRKANFDCNSARTA